MKPKVINTNNEDITNKNFTVNANFLQRHYKSGYNKALEDEIDFLKSLPIGNIRPSNDSETLKTANSYVYTQIKDRIQQLKREILNSKKKE
jgi:hypothetical protein